MPARRTPVGASSARAWSDMKPVYTAGDGSRTRMPEIVVETVSGKVRGLNERGVGIFKGIPYAAAPIAEYRFRPPPEIAPWTGTRDALAYGNLSIQADNAFS